MTEAIFAALIRRLTELVANNFVQLKKLTPENRRMLAVYISALYSALKDEETNG